MKTKLIPYLQIAGLLLVVAVPKAWAGGQCCGSGSAQVAAAEPQHSMEGSVDPQHQHGSMDMTTEPTSHGGIIHTFSALEFETVFTESDARLYVTSKDGTAADINGLKGTISITGSSDVTESVEFSVKNVSDDPMASQRHMPMRAEAISTYLSAPYTFGNQSDHAVSVAITLSGADNDEAANMQWEQPFVMTPLFGKACPMHPEQASLTDGECSVCGGMKLQSAQVIYGCCPACPEMRSTSPGTCAKCGMEMKLKGIGSMEIDKLKMEEHRHVENAG